MLLYRKFGNVREKFMNCLPREFKILANKESISHKDYTNTGMKNVANDSEIEN